MNSKESLTPTYPESSISPERDLKGMVILMTGTGDPKGIGAASARDAARRGARLFLTSTERSQNAGIELAQDIEKHGGEAYWVPADLTQAGIGNFLVAQAVDAYGRLDGVIHVAGWKKDTVFTELTLEDWQTAFEINLKGPVEITQAAMEQMKKQDPKGGFFTFVSSVVADAENGNIGQSLYQAFKAAQLGLVRTLGEELRTVQRNDKIRANVILPGLVLGTNMTEKLTEGQIRKLLEKLGQSEATPMDDVVQAISYYASPRCARANKQEVRILGGENYREKDLRPAA